ncbi:MAG: TorF family putative porin, partial [Mariprofundaceae bacterium]|nr:TorF family putative porin [Mariprofundaceae bacterium]
MRKDKQTIKESKMKKVYLAMMMVGLMGAGLATGATSAAAEEAASDISISGDIGVASQYVWRGVAQSIDTAGGNRPAVQGDIGLGYGDFSASMWFSNSYPSPDPQTLNKSVEEFDWTLDYSGSLGETGLGYSVGGIYYT